MANKFKIINVDHRDARVAAKLHAVQILAYRQEAELLGVKDFPPLTVSVSDIQELPENFWRFLLAMRLSAPSVLAPMKKPERIPSGRWWFVRPGNARVWPCA